MDSIEPREQHNTAGDRDDYAKGERTLYVLERGRRIAVKGQLLCVLTTEGSQILALPQHAVHRIVAGAAVEIERSALDLALGGMLDLSFVRHAGSGGGRVAPGDDRRGHSVVRQAMAAANPDFVVAVARSLVNARIANQRVQLFRMNRDTQLESVTSHSRAMLLLQKRLPLANTVDQLRGLEGASGALYWRALGSLCKAHGGAFRRSRPARDSLNATLNYFAFLLEQDARRAVLSSGLHPGIGFLHASRNGNDAMVYDLMEPFRAPLAEGIAIYLFNSRRLRPEMFEVNENAMPRMQREAIHAVIGAYETQAMRRIKVPWERGKLAWRRAVLRQAQLLAKAIRKGDPGIFKPFIMDI
jgi:CRISPR-associated protein Cas1